MRVLVVNAGSSSLKLRVLGPDDEVLGTEDAELDGTELDEASLDRALDALGAVEAVGHRVVHGGREHTEAVRIDDAVLAALEALTPLAPLHQPKALAGMAAVRRRRPDAPAVACFDTAFHARLDPAAATYPLPAAWRERFGLRRYGFHGLSHAHASRRGAELAGADAGARIVTCHLGAGCSLAAVRDGRSVDTTMGFTPLEGLAMATRSGSVDPGLLLWLQREAGMGADELADGLEHGSGLTGLAGTGDMRAVLERAGSGDADAVLALEVFLHRLRAGVAAMAAALGGLDLLVFTGGIGERSVPVRERAVAGLGFLGVDLDPDANAAAGGDAVIGTGVVVVAAREDLEIARQVRAVLRA